MDFKIQILGFRADIDSVSDILDRINSIKKDGEIIQLLNADAVAGERHIIHGVNHAFLAFQRGENLANDIGVEILLRISAQRQISKAFNILGLKEGFMNICAVLVNCEDDYCDVLSEMFGYDADVLIPDDDFLMDVYDISPDEVENISVENILVDRITRLIVNY